MQFFLFIAVLILTAFGLIAFQNSDVNVTMKFIKWTFENKPLVLLLAVPFAVGILTGSFIFVPPWLKKANLARTRNKRIHELESELAVFEERPGTDEGEKEEAEEGVKEEV
jgi:uncharacterized membrane protein YciS (DUF1049 family)